MFSRLARSSSRCGLPRSCRKKTNKLFIRSSRAGSGGDELYGEAGNDTLNAGSGGNTLLDGGSGDDVYYSGVGESTMRDESGNDRYHLQRMTFGTAGSVTRIDDRDGKGSVWLNGQLVRGEDLRIVSDTVRQTADGNYTLTKTDNTLYITMESYP